MADETSKGVRIVVESTRAAYEACSAVRNMLSNWVGGFSDLENALAGAYLRMSLWIESFIRLNDKRHFQALMHGARCLYELLIDLVELHRDPSLVGKFHAFTEVTKFGAAEKLVKVLDKFGVPDTPSVANERTYLANNRAKYDSLLQTHWPPGNKAPINWNGHLPSRTARLGRADEIEYRSFYPIFCWHSHSGLASVVNLDEEAFDLAVAFAHEYARKFYLRATDIIGKEFGIYDANPKIKEDVRSWMSKLSAETVVAMVQFQK